MNVSLCCELTSASYSRSCFERIAQKVGFGSIPRRLPSTYRLPWTRSVALSAKRSNLSAIIMRATTPLCFGILWYRNVEAVDRQRDQAVNTTR